MSGEARLAESVASDIRFKRFEMLLNQIREIVPMLEEATEYSGALAEEAQKMITDYAMQMKISNLDKDALKGFFKKPYVIMPTERKKENEWYLVVPKFLDVQIGWLHKVTEGFNIFLINRYVDWLTELPKGLKDELGFKDPLDISLEGLYIKGRDLDKAKEKYRKFIHKVEKGRILIKEKNKFELLSEMVRDGILPFTPEPVPDDYKVERKCDFQLRPFQRRDYEEFLRWGNVGIFYPPGVGKTYYGIWALTHLKGPHIVTVPSITLIEQWQERIELYTDLKVGEEVIVTTYQSALKKYAGKDFSLMIVDEAHHLPANEFGKLNFMKRKFTIGLSATPAREDGREDLIFALTWKAAGLSWDEFKKLGSIQNPPCHVWIVGNTTAKLKQLSTLLQETKKTLIFCDSIELGKAIAGRYEIPHVHGASKQRLKTLQESDVAVVSRVGDEGVSLPTIERVIEVDFLFGSRRQELQRFGRLLHGTKEGEHHIIFTVEEYAHDHKRLFSVMDKGFKIVIHREGVSEKVIQRTMQERRAPRTRYRSEARTSAEEPMKIANLPTSVSGLLALPGIQKRMQSLSKADQKVWAIMLQNDGRWYTREELAMLAGYSSPDTMRKSVNFPSLLVKKLIEKQGNKYRTNFSNMSLLRIS